MHDLKVWPGVEADGQKNTTTPGKSTSGEDQMSRLAKVPINVISYETPGKGRKTDQKGIIILLYYG